MPGITGKRSKPVMPDGAIAYPAYGKVTWLPDGAIAYPAYGKVTWLPDGAVAYPAYGKVTWLPDGAAAYRAYGKVTCLPDGAAAYRAYGKVTWLPDGAAAYRAYGKDTWLPDGAAAYQAYRKCYVGPIRRSRHRAISATSGAWRSAIQMPVHAPLPLLFSGATLQAASRQPAFQIPVVRTMAHSTAHRGRWSA